MKIYTSYFAKQKELEAAGITCIGICAITPSWFKGPNFACVAPSKDILFEYKANPDKERYIQRYTNEVLCILKDPQIFVNGLIYCSGGKDVAMLCYEKPEDFCHRHILADFLNKHLNLGIEEYKFEDKDKPKSISLF
jgi:uncharacterized protein YeaO (DUF488 family)